MSKSTIEYWNPLKPENNKVWEPIPGMEGVTEQLTLAMDAESGDYTRLTKFKAGADTKEFGAKSHTYPEEIFIVSGRLYDKAFNRWLEAGEYASRPPGEVHGPFKADVETVVLEMSYPSQAVEL